jgi:hypothetical protein
MHARFAIPVRLHYGFNSYKEETSGGKRSAPLSGA